ncbi:LysR family transcriptional regulator, partial [Pseudomonas helleri]
MKSVDAIVRRVTLRELRLLAAIAHSGSILKAAQEVGLSQPALSKALADLEETLGVRLFDRTNRGVEPTPHGSVFIRRALAVFDEMRRGVEEGVVSRKPRNFRQPINMALSRARSMRSCIACMTS